MKMNAWIMLCMLSFISLAGAENRNVSRAKKNSSILRSSKRLVAGQKNFARRNQRARGLFNPRAPNNPLKLVLFDFDNTIMSTHGIINFTLHKALENLGFEATLQEVNDAKGLKRVHRKLVMKDSVDEADHLFKKSFDDFVSETDRVTVSQSFKDFVQQTQLKPYVGFEKVLRELNESGVFLGIATARRASTADLILRRVGLRQWFHVIAGTAATNVPPKPAPDMLLEIAKHFKINSNQAVMIGDSDEDIVAGKKAGMSTVKVFFAKDSVEYAPLETRADRVVQQPLELLDVFFYNNKK